ncbi:MAG: type II toxin-antitoxin system RelE/ParE family toxin [Treponema sp.]|uniref:type II toxin-antitoxin system RelE/ParE family toxin n=1 Tax=Treponema sp. TaxID=166 RepID=UPI0025D2D0F8|nr:type II toxin-antitoxin system RelE/ParE family toxin [Treponema sp.]MBQ9281244.1 type II toxin-antitoxin system RelE/ParE family toxin [Treponema sp.]
MEFIETPIFTKTITKLLSDDEYSDFQKYLIENPESGDVIKGGSGIRKIRWNLAGRGKSGSIRVIYYYKVVNNQIFLIYACTKKKKSDLSEQEKKLFGEIAKEFAR